MNTPLQHTDQFFVGPRKYIHSIPLMTATDASNVTVVINKMLRSRYELVYETTNYGYLEFNGTRVYIKPTAGKPPSREFSALSDYNKWLFEILENFRYMHVRLEACRIFTIYATICKDVFDQGIQPKDLEYRLHQDKNYWYFTAYHGDICAYSSRNIKK